MLNVTFERNVVREPAREIPLIDDVDVVVVGGGPSGVPAAVAAARCGARTRLIERSSFLGGSATGAMVMNFQGFYWRDRRITGGIAHEIVERLMKKGAGRGFEKFVLAEASDTPFEVHNFPFDPEVLKLVLDEMVEEEHVDVLFHTRATDPIIQDGRVAGVVIQGLSERKAIKASVVIDAGADAIIARRAGAEIENAAEDIKLRQPMTLMVRLANVDVATFRALPREEKQRLSKLGMATGEMAVRNLSVKTPPGGGPGDVIVHMTRVEGLNAADEADLTQAEFEGRRQVRRLLGFLRREVPGFRTCTLMALAPWIGVRETWRVVGDYVLTGEDVMSTKQFPDPIALGGGPLDVHHSSGGGFTVLEPRAPFPIPYRCLLPKGVHGLLVTGRCASATKDGMGAIRHMGNAMSLGQAAGAAAAIAAKNAVGPRDIVYSELRRTLETQGVILENIVSTVESEVSSMIKG